ncbi:uncharacterized protein [Asterias amurensis]|uniref:uncharacterized protein n=1 Tax=Asterias amurensis TaxID=7602 RepID=UPI003AB8BA3B
MSDLEICRLAYEGDLRALTEQVEADKSIINKLDKSERTALHWAASGKRINVVRYILELKPAVNVNIRDDSNWTPLHIAASVGQEDIVTVLVSKGAEVNSANSTGQTPLHYAASRDRQKVAEILLEHGADTNIAERVGATPMHRAASKGNLEIVKLLLNYNCRLDQQDCVGNTALHMACEEDRVKEATVLVQHGASLHITNKEEQTPLDLAQVGLASTLSRLKE